MTSASGFLFGTACTPGLHVIVVQSVSGDGNQRLECLEHRDIADDLGVKSH